MTKRSFLAKVPKIPTVIRIGGYELRRKKGFMGLPRVELGKVAKFPVEFVGTSVGAESDAEDIRRFPHSTSNTAGLKLGLRPVQGQLSIRLTDPGLGVEDLDHDGQVIEAAYEQIVPGIGDVKGHVTSSGDWDAALSSNVPELGLFRAKLDSHMDWSVVLEKSYEPFKGFVPTANYGATQDGMLFQANVSGGFDHNSKFSYALSNPAGKYGPQDYIHKGKISLDSPSGHHGMVLNGMYNRQLPKEPLRGSLTYTARGKKGSFGASIDSDKYKLQAKRGHFELATTVGREAEAAGRTTELQMRAGFLTATAKAVGDKARVRVGVDF